MVIFGPRAMRNTEREIHYSFLVGLFRAPIMTLKTAVKVVIGSSHVSNIIKLTVKKYL